MTRADALRALIERVKAGELAELPLLRAAGVDMADADAARLGDLNAVARLEAPLKERGWVGPFIAPDLDGEGIHVEWAAPDEPDGDGPEALATTEALARLLAVLRALLWEAEHG